MCGIAGFLSVSSRAPQTESEGVLRRMAETLVHRGPDDMGVWADPDAGIGLAHRRLSILDLSPQGHQPMVSACRRFVVSFNGEIYNHREIRRALDRESLSTPPRGGPSLPLRWRGTSDTEVLLAAISAWGLARALKNLVGMYAFALWDRADRGLHLVRDRLGEKPLYYGWAGRTLVFASELKALKAHPAWRGGVDGEALTAYVRYGYVPAPKAIFTGTYKVPPASVISLSAESGMRYGSGDPIPSWQYWSARDVAFASKDEFFRGSAQDAVARLEELLSNAVRMQMVADVPVGAFLSGGVDSSAVVALMQCASSRAARTFTIGFMEEGYNEARQAKSVARYLGTDHTELYITPAEAREVIPDLPKIYDEPFGDASQIPTFLVSRLARQKVTVSLSGDGGDELFGGYPRYLLARRIWRLRRSLPYPLRTRLAGIANHVLKGGAERLYRIMLARMPSTVATRLPSRERVLRLLTALQAPSLPSFYQQFLSHVREPTRLVLGGQEPTPSFAESELPTRPHGLLQWLMYLDLTGYFPDDILVKVDRAAMANSLETRAPLLDHRLVEFSLRLPVRLKINRGGTKWVLREVLYRHVPKSLVERPKMGFGVPVGAWLRGPLREWADDLLDPGRLRQDGLLNAQLVGTLWQDHRAGRQDWQYPLWDLLMFQAWLRAHGVRQP